MHGDRKVSTKNLARQAGRKSIAPCTPLPVYMERSITELPAVYINGGRRGLLVRVKTEDLLRLLKPQLVAAALED